MGTVAHGAAGAVATGSTSLSVAAPAGTSQNDTEYMAVITAGVGTPASSGWSTVQQVQDTTNSFTLALLKRDAPATNGAVTVSGLTSSSCGFRWFVTQDNKSEFVLCFGTRGAGVNNIPSDLQSCNATDLVYGIVGMDNDGSYSAQVITYNASNNVSATEIADGLTTTGTDTSITGFYATTPSNTTFTDSSWTTTPGTGGDVAKAYIFIRVRSAAAVGKNLALLWNVLVNSTGTPVNRDLQLLWNAAAPVGKVNQLIWNVKAALGKDLQLKWNVLTSVFKTLAFVWHVLSPVGKVNQLIWNANAAVGKVNQLVWNAYVTVNKDLSFVWNLLSPVGKDNQLIWNTLFNGKINLLTTGHNSTNILAGQTYSTASVAPVGKSVIYLYVISHLASGTPTQPTVSGLGLTWDLVTSITTSTTPKAFLFRAYAGDTAPTPGAITFTVGEDTSGFLWSVVQVTGVNLSGSNGANSAKQVKAASVASTTTPSLSFDTAPAAQDATLAFIHITSTGSITPGSSYAELGNDVSNSSPTARLSTVSDETTPGSTVDATLGLTATSLWIIVELDVMVAVGKSGSLLWNILTPVAKASQFIWNLRALAGKNNQAVWNVRAAVGASSQSIWNVRAAVGNSRVLIWNVLSTVGNSRVLLWNTRATVAKSIILQWNVSGAVGKTVQLLWNVASTVNKNVSLLWNVLVNGSAAVGKDLALLWNLSAPVGKNNQLVWTVNTKTTKDLSLLWTVRINAAKALSLLWNVTALASAPVGKDLSLVWNVRAAVGRSYQYYWSVNTKTSKDISLKWNVLTPAGKSVTYVWNLKAPTGKSLGVYWNTLYVFRWTGVPGAVPSFVAGSGAGGSWTPGSNGNSIWTPIADDSQVWT